MFVYISKTFCTQFSERERERERERSYEASISERDKRKN
jgi:hypothetical protein